MSQTKYKGGKNTLASASKGPVDLRLLTGFRNSYGLVVLEAAYALITAAEAISIALLIGRAIQTFLSPKSSATLAIYVAVAVGVILLRNFGSVILEKRINTASGAIAESMAKTLLEDLPQSRRLKKLGLTPLEIGITSSKGIDDIFTYLSVFTRDIALVLILCPTAFITLFLVDHRSAVLVGLSLSLIPGFMIVLGKKAQKRANERWNALTYLGGKFLDLTTGLLTLRGLGIARSHGSMIRFASEQYRKETNYGLRVALLSNAVLELLATLATAIVAVGVGQKLYAGQIPVERAVTAVLLVPAIFAPIRSASTQFHATTDAQLAIDNYFKITATKEMEFCPQILHDDSGYKVLDAKGLVLETQVLHRSDAIGLSISVPRVGITCVTGPSGSGKSTLLRTIIGELEPAEGEIIYYSSKSKLNEIIAYLPQSPNMISGTIKDNIVISRRSATGPELNIALNKAQLDEVLLHQGWELDSLLSENGMNLSAGERQRVALARLFLQNKPLYVLDEPTANLDRATELRVIAGLKELARSAALIIATHSVQIKEAAQTTIELTSGAEIAHE